MTQETKANQGKGAIFDLDGTLLDSMGVWDQVDVDFLAKRGIEVPDDAIENLRTVGDVVKFVDSHKG
jgi:beta-phosphoglucomutase-like phosphatase (HAD superfamily)